jgi:hypothetical protein
LQLKQEELTVAASEGLAIYDEADRRVGLTLDGVEGLSIEIKWRDSEGEDHAVSVAPDEDSDEPTLPWVSVDYGTLSTPAHLVREANSDR